MAVKPLLVAFSALLPAWNGCKTVPGSLLGPLGHLGPNAVEMLGPYPPEIATQRLLGAFWRYLPRWNGRKTASGSLLQAPTPLTGLRMFQGRNPFQDLDLGIIP